MHKPIIVMSIERGRKRSFIKSYIAKVEQKGKFVLVKSIKLKLEKFRFPLFAILRLFARVVSYLDKLYFFTFDH